MYRSLWIALLLGCACEVNAQDSPVRNIFSLNDLARMRRFRPASPYDQLGDYLLLDAWEEQARKTDNVRSRYKVLEELALGRMQALGNKWSLGLDGLVDVYSASNRVDGLWLGYEVFLARDIAKGHRFVFRTAHNYTTHGRSYMTTNRVLYFYAPQRAGLALLDAGVTSYETSHITNEEAYTRAFVSTLGTNNYDRNYRKHYVSLRNSIYLTKGVRLDALGVYEKRNPQIGTKGEPHQLLHGELRLSYDTSPYGSSSVDYPSPHTHPRGFFAPELGLVYRTDKAYSPSTPFNQTFWGHAFELSLRMAYALGIRKHLEWSVVGEYAYKKDSSNLDASYRVLPVSDGINRRSIRGTWVTGSHQKLRQGTWVWATVDYNGGQVALARLPILRHMQMDEEFHLRSMIASSGKRWGEVGYSIGWGQLFRLGVFGGGDLRGAFELGFKLSVPLLYLTSYSSTRY